MKRREFLKEGVKYVCLFFCFGRIGSANASGIPVVDLANLAQSVLAAIRLALSNVNEAMMIANQVKSLANDIRNLTTLEFSILDEFGSQFRDLFSAVGSVQGLMQNFETLQEKFEELYPEYNNIGTPLDLETISTEVNKWLDESREMIKGASLTGAKVLEALPQTQAQLDRLVADSQGAVGILQAAQAGNQIAATISGNMMNISAQLATYSQAHMSHLQKLNGEEAIKQNRLKNVTRSIKPSTEPSVPMNLF